MNYHDVCGGTGIKLVPNGQDDFDPEFCVCEEGAFRQTLAQLV